MKKLTKDNSGLSLVELLVAIVVLGIICIPLITTFVNSGKINRNASRVHSSTTLAQGIMEEYKATDLEKMIADVSDSGVASVNSTLNTSVAVTVEEQKIVSENKEAFTEYVFYEPNLTANNGSVYDAKITVNPLPYSQFGTVTDSSDINIAKIPDLPLIDNSSCPVIANQINSMDRKSATGEDPIAKRIFPLLGEFTEAQLSALDIDTVDKLSAKLKKEINISFTNELYDAITKQQMVKVRCDINYFYPVPGGERVYTVNVYQSRYPMGRESLSEDDKSDPTLESRMDAYIFWTPSYYNSGADTINIINKTGCRIKTYFIKQETVLNPVYTLTFSDDSGSKLVFNNSIHKDGRLCENNISLISNLTDEANLYEKQAGVRCYEITVDLYKSDGSYSDLVTSITSTKEVYK